MPGYRAARLAELIHKELAHRLRLQIKDPRVVDVSITRVEVSGDLGVATAYYLPLGGGGASAELQAGLEDAARALRGPVGRALRLRRSPLVVFEHDAHFERAVSVTRLLDRIGDELRTADGEEE